MLKTADLAVETWKVSWQGSRVNPLDHSQSITQTLTSTKGFLIKKKICHEQKVLSREKKIRGQKVVTRISLIYNEVKKGDLMRTKNVVA